MDYLKTGRRSGSARAAPRGSRWVEADARDEPPAPAGTRSSTPLSKKLLPYRHAARARAEDTAPTRRYCPMARPAPRALALIAARAAVIDGAAAVAAGDPLAIAPDENRLHQSFDAGARRPRRRPSRRLPWRRWPGQRRAGRKQQGKDRAQPKICACAPPPDGASTNRVQLDRRRFKPQR